MAIIRDIEEVTTDLICRNHPKPVDIKLTYIKFPNGNTQEWLYCPKCWTTHPGKKKVEK